jgi:hypothetical protein
MGAPRFRTGEGTRGAYQGTLRDPAGRLGATLVQETLLLPVPS